MLKDPCPLRRERSVVTTGPPGKSPYCLKNTGSHTLVCGLQGLLGRTSGRWGWGGRRKGREEGEEEEEEEEEEGALSFYSLYLLYGLSHSQGAHIQILFA